MNWFDFSDSQFLAVFIISLVVIAFLTFLFISIGISSRNLYKDYKEIKNSSLSTRVYIIDLKKNTVVYFEKNNLRHKKKINMDDFYLRFNSNDVAKVKNWIFDISLDFKSVDPYLEVDVLLNKGHTSYFSLLKLLKYDAIEGIIHAESFILKYISPNNFGKKRKGMPIGVLKRSEIEELVIKDKSTRGYTYAIRFFYKKQLVLSNDKIERYMMMTLKNVVYPFAANPKLPRQIMDDGLNEMLLFDLRIDNSEEALRLANSIARSIKKCIGVNGFDGSVSFSIGVLENSLFYQDFDSMVTKAQESCMNGQHTSQEIVVYKKEANPFGEIEKYRNEVEKLLKPGALRYLFRPIVDCDRKRVSGFFEYVKAYDTPFSSYEEMSKYASRFNKNKELFAIIAKYVIPKFSSESQDRSARLFLSCSFMDIDYIVSVLSRIPEVDNVRLVLVFNEQEINENASNLEALKNQLDSLREENFELAMLMKDNNLLLDSSVYKSFDYFVAGSSMIGEIKVNNRSRLSIHSLIEQLLKYKKPIIATDLESWQSIELILKSGITRVSTEVVSPSNDMLLPIDKKKMDRLVETNNKYN